MRHQNTHTRNVKGHERKSKVQEARRHTSDNSIRADVTGQTGGPERGLKGIKVQMCKHIRAAGVNRHGRCTTRTKLS